MQGDKRVSGKFPTTAGTKHYRMIGSYNDIYIGTVHMNFKYICS